MSEPRKVYNVTYDNTYEAVTRSFDTKKAAIDFYSRLKERDDIPDAHFWEQTVKRKRK